MSWVKYIHKKYFHEAYGILIRLLRIKSSESLKAVMNHRTHLHAARGLSMNTYFIEIIPIHNLPYHTSYILYVYMRSNIQGVTWYLMGRAVCLANTVHWSGRLYYATFNGISPLYITRINRLVCNPSCLCQLGIVSPYQATPTQLLLHARRYNNSYMWMEAV